MGNKTKFSHSVILDYEKCRGCTTCIRRCPTEAIRVCNSEFINTHPFNKVKAMQRWGNLGIAF